jgi:hypothetical protein
VHEPVERTVVASYGDYRQAQRAVDFLADERIPVEHVTIVGSGLKVVETVTGRLSWGRAALAGPISGLWPGLLVGWFVAIFSDVTVDSGHADPARTVLGRLGCVSGNGRSPASYSPPLRGV